MLNAQAASAPLLAARYAGSVQGRAAFGANAGRTPVRLGATANAPWQELRRNCHSLLDGYDLHAAVVVPAPALRSVTIASTAGPTAAYASRSRLRGKTVPPTCCFRPTNSYNASLHS